MSSTSRLALALAFGSGCAVNTEPPAPSAIETDSQALGATLAASIEDGARWFGAPSSALASSPSCLTRSGNTSDGDADNVPTNAALTFNCVEGPSDIRTLTGTEMINDPYPDETEWAFEANPHLHTTLTTPSQDSIATDTSGRISAFDDSGWYYLKRDLDITTVISSPAGATTTVGAHSSDLLLYHSESDWDWADPVMPVGAIGPSGTWKVTIGDVTSEVTFGELLSLSLAFTPSCASRVTSGTVSGTYQGDGHMNTIAIMWTDCGQSTVTYTAN